MHPSTPPAGRVMSNQIHVTNNGRVQTFAAVETAAGVTVLSTGGGLATRRCTSRSRRARGWRA